MVATITVVSLAMALGDPIITTHHNGELKLPKLSRSVTLLIWAARLLRLSRKVYFDCLAFLTNPRSREYWLACEKVGQQYVRWDFFEMSEETRQEQWRYSHKSHAVVPRSAGTMRNLDACYPIPLRKVNISLRA